MITVNGQAITEAEILAEMQYHPAATRDEAFSQAAQALVVRELLLQRAAAAGISWTADDPGAEEDAIDQLLGRELKLPVPDLAACRRYYDNNRRKFRSQDLFEASHILYLAPRDDVDARARARHAAKRALRMLTSAPDRFAEIAKAESRCASAGEGGRLGQIAAGETAPEIDTFLHNLEDGQLCPVPIETDYGVHVLKLHRNTPGSTVPFEEVEGAISRHLRATTWSRAVSDYISLLAGSVEIGGWNVKHGTSPVQ